MELKDKSNYALSPYTGYTRENWIELTAKIIAGFMQHANPKTGVLTLTGNPEETRLHRQLKNPGSFVEAFERTHMAVAAYIAATGKTTVEGYPGDIGEIFRKGMATFTDPKNPYAPNYKKGQSFGTGTVIAMLLAPEYFLKPLSKEVRKNLAGQLTHIISRQQNDTNTLLFSMLPAVIMDRLGEKYDRELLDDYFDRILGMYCGDGWFIDGWNRGFDHYNFWGFQFYLHLLVSHDKKWGKKYKERIREITEKHEKTLLFYFGKDGGPVPKGRSLNYRFACVSGIGAAQISGLSSLDPGVARRISSGALKYFWDNECLSSRGLIEAGFRASNSCVGEDYTDSGAPYWSATGLISLVLSKAHPFWTAKEKPAMADKTGVSRCPVRGANLVLKADGRRGEAKIHSAGEIFKHRRVWQAGSKYFQHTYSSTVGYALSGDLGRELAAGRTGISRDKKHWSLRTWPRVISLDEKHLLSEWDSWPGLSGETGTVVTETFILDDGEVHVFWHTSKKPKYLCIGGYAVQVSHIEKPEIDCFKNEIEIKSALMWSKLKVVLGPPGRLEAEEVKPAKGFKHSHIFEGWSVFTKWTSKLPVAPNKKVVVWVDAARRKEVPATAACPVSIKIDGDNIKIIPG